MMHGSSRHAAPLKGRLEDSLAPGTRYYGDCGPHAKRDAVPRGLGCFLWTHQPIGRARLFYYSRSAKPSLSPINSVTNFVCN